MNTQYTYEIEFDVMGACRERYDRWVSEGSLKWVSHPTIAAFEVQYNTNRLSPEVKFLFGFSSIEDWTAFITSEIHEAAKETLRGVTTRLEGTLWEQGGIKLEKPDSQEYNTSLPSSASVREELS